MAEKISVQIALDGGAEVKQQLADIGKAGTQAFDGLNEAGTTAAEGIAKVGEASQTTGEQLNTVQGSADKASESLSKVSLESVKTSAEIAKLGLEITKLGVEIGLAVARHKTLAQSLFGLVSGANTAVKALSLLAPELTAIAVVAAPVALAVAGTVVAFEAIEKAATAAAKGYEALNHSLQTLSSNTGQSFDSLQKGQAAFEQLGISADKYGEALTKLSQIDVGGKVTESLNAMLEAEKKLIELRQKSEGRELTFAEVGRLQEINALLGTVANSEQKLGDARANAAKTSANNLQALIPLIQQIAAGSKDIKFDGLVTAESKINAVAIAMKQAADNGQIAGQVLVNFIANADRLSAIQVGAKFGITEAEVDRIRNLGGQLGIVDDIWKRIQGAGVLIPPDSAAAFDRMRVKIDEANAASARLRQALSSSFVPMEAAKLVGDLESIKTALTNVAAAGVEAFTRMPSTIDSATRALQALQTLVNNFTWDNAVNGVFKLGQALGSLTISGKVSQALQAIFGDADKTTQAVQGTNQALAQTGQAASTTAGQLELITNPFTGMPEAAYATNTALQQTGQAASTTAGRLELITNPFTGMPEAAYATNTAVAETGTTGQKAFDQVGTAAGGASQKIGQVNTATSGITWDAISSAGVAAWNALTNAIQGAIDKLLRFLGLRGSAPAPATGGGGAEGRARGGLLGGRGTGTSDSNLAWVSRGEHIMPARAVAQPGVLSFLEALRRSGGNLSRVLDGMGRFALGGMVPRAIPAFATGGLSGGMSNVTIAFPGLPEIGGLRASSGVVDELRKAAALAQVRSGGRKPSRYS